MAVKDLVVAIALALTVLIVWLSAAGLVASRATWDRLHYLSPLAFAAIPLAIAVWLQNGLTAQASIEALLLAVLILATNPIATYALGRSLRVRETGALRVEPEDVAL